MLRPALLLALLFALPLAPPSRAEEPAVAPDVQAPSSPILVQSHQSFVRITGGRAAGNTTWTIAVLDPARAQGHPAPPELEGAEARGASIRFGELRLPPGLAAGSTLTFTASLPSVSAPFSPSGTFRTVPGVPVARAELVVRASGAPLSVWSDPTGRPEWTSPRNDEVKIVWRDVEPDAPAHAIWTGAASWLDEGALLRSQVEPRLTRELGRELSRDAAAITPASATDAVFRAIKLTPSASEAWDGRPAREVIAAGSGTAAERGLVLISLLRFAGYDPSPALFRPAALAGPVPDGLAAPSLLPRPVVVVPMGDRAVWIDPGADRVLVPALPSDLAGAAVWVPGDLPRRLPATGDVDGRASISGEIRLDRAGPASFSIVIAATGSAEEYLRETLSALDDAGRQRWLLDILGQGWPGIERLMVTATGVGTRDKPLTLTVRGQLPAQVAPVFEGLYRSSGRALLAPALASWLPPRTLVAEDLSVSAPPGLTLLTITEPPSATHPAAIVARSARREGDRVILSTTIERPHHHLTRADHDQAQAALSAEAQSGPELLHLYEATPAVARRARAIPLPAADRVALETVILWRAARYGAARRLLGRYLAPIGVSELDRALRTIQAPYELRRELVDLPRTEADKLATVPLLVAMKRGDEAWRRAAQVAATQVHALRVDARLHMVALQPPAAPDPAIDPEGAAIWRDPLELLLEAEASAARVAGGQPDPRVQTAKARILLDRGQTEAALALLRAAAERSSDPEVAILLAAASARAGVALDRVQESLALAIARAPGDAAIYARVAETLGELGAHPEALAHALTAARLDNRSSAAWLRVSERAMLAGELPAAVFAAERASGLALTDTAAATALATTATLAGRLDLATIGWGRGGAAPELVGPPSAAELVGLVPQEHLLAVLRHHDDEVVADAGLLSLRAELELASGDRDRAVRDGVLLSERHGIARGALVAFGASLGEVWRSDGAASLDAIAAGDPAARAARVELRAVLGGRIDLDLRRMDDDPRARIWRLAASDPAGLGAEDPAWTPGLPPSSDAPRGFTPNPILGAARGVVAWSSALSQHAVIRHAGTTDLPPPLSLLYTIERPALRSLPGGAAVHRLSGGALPLFAAIRNDNGERTIGLGHSPEAAARALQSVPAR